VGNEKTSIIIRKIFGIPIRVEISWIILYAFLTLALAIGYYPVVLRGRAPLLYWSLGALTILFLFGSLLVHEFGHALIAHHYHIPVSMISLFLSGGSIHMPTLPANAPAEFWIATAGPLANIGITAILALFSFAIENFLGPTEVLFAPIKVLIATNLAVAIFNLLPVMPLDGGRAFRAMIWRSSNDPNKASTLAGVEGQFVAYIFIVFGVVQVFSGNLIYGLWVAVTGFILDRAASNHHSELDSMRHLKNRPISDVMSTEIFTLPEDITIQEFFKHFFLRDDRHIFLVERDDQPIGLFSLDQLGQIPRSIWNEIAITQIMTPVDQLNWVGPDTKFWEAMQVMHINRLEVLIVLQDQKILGLVTQADIIHIIRKFG
jgi:Zn-dependent protease